MTTNIPSYIKILTLRITGKTRDLERKIKRQSTSPATVDDVLSDATDATEGSLLRRHRCMQRLTFGVRDMRTKAKRDPRRRLTRNALDVHGNICATKP